MTIKALIYVSDKTYGSGGSANESGKFQAALESKYGARFKYVDIGRGASWPAFVSEIIFVSAAATALKLFLSGAEIVEAWSTWRKLFGKVFAFNTGVIVHSRETAAILAVNEVLKTIDKFPKRLKLKGYRCTNSHLESGLSPESIKSNNKLEDGPAGSSLDGAKHWFDISADERIFRVSVELKQVKLLELQLLKKQSRKPKTNRKKSKPGSRNNE
jgi:hypothetical protein